MLRDEDKHAIEDLFERLRRVENNSGPRDRDAEALIRQRLSENPAAAYYMAQTIIVQEAALRDQQAKIEAIESTRPRRSERDLRGSLRNENEGESKDDEPAKDEDAKDGDKPKPDAGASTDEKADEKEEAKEAETTDEQPVDYQLARALDLLRGIALYRGRMVN